MTLGPFSPSRTGRSAPPIRLRGVRGSRPVRPRIALAVVPAVVALWLSGASAPADAEIIGTLVDPQHPSVEPAMDILIASIDQNHGRLTFSMQVRGAIPTSLPNPEDTITFLWFVDTDKNAATGQPHGDLGSEFNVRAVIGQVYGGGFVDICGSVPGGGTGSVTVDGDEVRLVIYMPQIGNPHDFYWKCVSFRVTNGSHQPGNPETARAYADALPYTPVARVTVTTPLLALCPAGPATGQLAVELRDAAGHILPNQEHDLAFHSTHEQVATVDANGLVTAIAPPQEHWQTPYIEAWGDGVMAHNSAVIRVTNVDLGLTWRMYPSAHLSYFIVPLIEGVDLDGITRNYQVVEATERAWTEQTLMIGTVPGEGTHQYLVLDVTNDPVTCPCGASGNPIRLGWLYGQPVHNSCYIVNDPLNRIPQWFVYFHELGHNFTCACNSFNLFCMGPSGPHNSTYCEGLASLAALWCARAIVEAPQGLGPLAVTNIEASFQGQVAYFQQRLDEYLDAGADYETVEPNALDGILCAMEATWTRRVWFDLMSTFLPAPDPLPVALDTKEKQATWFVAAMSVSTGQDQRALFRDVYGFPVDEGAWPEIFAAVATRIAARSWDPEELGEPMAARSNRVLSCWPNPTSGRTTLRFALDRGGPVDLSVFDPAGRRVASPVGAVLGPGAHEEPWGGRGSDGRPVGAGVYFVRLTWPDGRVTGEKLLVIR